MGFPQNTSAGRGAPSTGGFVDVIGILLVAVPLAILLLALSSTVGGQTIRTGTIAGTVTDESGAIIPGVTITLSSPALLVPQLVEHSNVRGEYQFVDLPPGTSLDQAHKVVDFMNKNLAGMSMTIFDNHPLYNWKPD